MKFQITPDFIENVPKIPYRNGVGNYEGVVSHETANYASAANEINYERKNWRNGYVHFFVDASGIRQSADMDYTTYGAGSVANKRYVHVELCRVRNPEDFHKSYTMYVWLLAHILYNKRLGVVDGETLVSHYWVSVHLGDTNHADPIDYLQTWGIAWKQHVENVKKAYQEMEDEDQMNELLERIQRLENLHNMPVPDWAKEAVDAAVKANLIDTPDKASYDFYRLITVLHRKGVI